MNKRVSDLITSKEIEKWDIGDSITITAGTGAGKSYFIKNILYDFAKKKNKKILMLIHRKNCVDQFKEELIRDNKIDTIEVKTYQSLEMKELRNISNDFSQYAYIVCDEFHYFMSDASYNKTTDISLNLILKQNKSIKIFMSATGDYMKKYIKTIKNIETINYELPINHNNIQRLIFYNKDESLCDFIERCVINHQKAIFFLQSAEKAYNLYFKYKKYSLFNCSRADKHYRYVDSDKINNMLKNEKFEEPILITTTCLDAGVNICDTELKNIIVDVKDIGSLVQCIGRKRQQNDNDKIDVYIKTITNNELGGMKTQLKNKIKMSEFANSHTVKETIEKYQRQKDISDIIYYDTVEEDDKCTQKINEMRFFKCKIDISDIDIMLLYKKYGYCKYMADLLGFYDNDTGKYHYSIWEEDSNDIKLEEYLNSIVGKRLYKKEQKELQDVFNTYGLNARTLGINTLNGYLKDNKMNYVIQSDIENSRKSKQYKKTYWIIGQINFNN